MKAALSILLAVTGLSCASPATPASPEAGFDLRVKLNDTYNPNLTRTTLVHINEPFAAYCNDGKVQTTVWGELHPERDGKYPLDLSICEWESKTSNVTDTGTYYLELGITASDGFAASLVFFREVTLQRHAFPP